MSRLPELALITCSPGSGSTAYGYLLNLHPSVLCLEESALLDPEGEVTLRDKLQRGVLASKPSVLLPGTPDLGIWSEDAAGVMRELAGGQVHDIPALAASLVGISQKRDACLVVEKFPNLGNRFCSVLIQRKIKAIFLTRHPFGAISSIIRKMEAPLASSIHLGHMATPGLNWGPMVEGGGYDSSLLDLMTLQYMSCITELEAALATGLPVAILRYEQLLTSPVAVYQETCRHLGLTWTPDIAQLFRGLCLDTSKATAWERQLSPRYQAAILRTLSSCSGLQLLTSLYPEVRQPLSNRGV